jgi:hypothetical protein
MAVTGKIIVRGIAAAAALLMAGHAAAQTLVVRSSGPSMAAYPAGKSLANNAKLSLKAGDSVTVLDAQGTHVFKGPGVYSASGSTASSFVASVLNNSGKRQVRTGAVRGGMKMDRPANVWMVDASKSGTVCYAGTQKVALWLPRRANSGTMSLTRVSDGKSVPLTLMDGQAILRWPVETFPIADGDSFRLEGGGLTEPTTLRFASVGADAQLPQKMVSAMIRVGCTDQLDVLIATTEVAPEEEEGEPLG